MTDEAVPAKVPRIDDTTDAESTGVASAAAPSVGSAAAPPHPVVGEAEWIALRKELLEEEKALARAKVALAQKRAALPWTPVKEYTLLGGWWCLKGASGAGSHTPDSIWCCVRICLWCADATGAPVTLSSLLPGDGAELVVFHMCVGGVRVCQSCWSWVTLRPLTLPRPPPLPCHTLTP
jgi:hypothetical protein